jgi:cytochrome c peroxidase
MQSRLFAWSAAVALPCLTAGTMMSACGGDPGTSGEHHATWEAGTPTDYFDAGGGGPASLCVDGGGDYPNVTSMGLLATVPNLVFDGADANGAHGTIAMRDYFEPCASASRLLVVRVGATWCGTCLWHSSHTKALLDADPAIGARVELLDVLVANEDNMPATFADIAAWRAKSDVPRRTAIDPSFAFGALNAARAPLPLYVFIDTRTMMILTRLADPDPDLLALRIRQEVASLDRAPAPMFTPAPLEDDRFTQDQWDMIRAMGSAGAPPLDPTNAHADDANAAALGKRLFADTSLTPSNGVSCAKCHDSAQAFTDSLPQSIGLAKVDRNAPSLLFAAWSRWQFWDGRADTLWMQALGPLKNAKEMGSSRLFVAHAIFDRYKADYEAIFGAMPAMSDPARFPANAKPGDAAWSAMSASDQHDVDVVYVNVGKSIAAFERTLRAKPNALDAYAAGDKTALTAQEKDGLAAFFRAGCAQCHWGPRLTDDAFHAVRFPTGRQDGAADRGRIDGIGQLVASEFLATSSFSDAPRSPYALTPAPTSMLGAFKTPSLRGVPRTAPYGHGGTLATIEDVVKNYSTSGLDDSSALAVGTSEAWLPRFDAPTQSALPAFLQTLAADLP